MTKVPRQAARPEAVRFWRSVKITGQIGIGFLFVVGLIWWDRQGRPAGADPMLVMLAVLGALDFALVLVAGRKVKRLRDD